MSEPLPAAALPRWATPASQRQDPDLPETEGPSPAEGTTGPRPPISPPFGQPDPKPEAPAPPRTRTSSGGDPLEVSKVLAGLLTVIIGGLAWVIARRGYELRTPTEHEMRDFTDPVGRIATRHLDMAMFSPDLADATMATAAAVKYASSSPIGTPAHTAGEFAPYDPDQENP